MVYRPRYLDGKRALKRWKNGVSFSAKGLIIHQSSGWSLRFSEKGIEKYDGQGKPIGIYGSDGKLLLY